MNFGRRFAYINVDVGVKAADTDSKLGHPSEDDSRAG
jgi:hypothetical protein